MALGGGGFWDPQGRASALPLGLLTLSRDLQPGSHRHRHPVCGWDVLVGVLPLPLPPWPEGKSGCHRRCLQRVLSGKTQEPVDSQSPQRVGSNEVPVSVLWGHCNHHEGAGQLKQRQCVLRRFREPAARTGGPSLRSVALQSPGRLPSVLTCASSCHTRGPSDRGSS